jgi:hypothetical protein
MGTKGSTRDRFGAAGESGEGGACAWAADGLAEDVEDGWDAEDDWDAEMVGVEDGWDAEMVGVEDDWDAGMVGVEDDWDAVMVGVGDDWDAELVGDEDDWDAEMVGVEDDWDVGAEGTSRSMMAAALAKAVSTVTGAEGVPGGEVLERIMRTRRAGRRGQGDRSSRGGTRRRPFACARESARMRA